MGIIHISLFDVVIHMKILSWCIECHIFCYSLRVYNNVEIYRLYIIPNEFLCHYYFQCDLKIIEIKDVIDLW